MGEDYILVFLIYKSTNWMYEFLVKDISACNLSSGGGAAILDFPLVSLDLTIKGALPTHTHKPQESSLKPQESIIMYIYI